MSFSMWGWGSTYRTSNSEYGKFATANYGGRSAPGLHQSQTLGVPVVTCGNAYVNSYNLRPVSTGHQGQMGVNGGQTQSETSSKVAMSPLKPETLEELTPKTQDAPLQQGVQWADQLAKDVQSKMCLGSAASNSINRTPPAPLEPVPAAKKTTVTSLPHVPSVPGMTMGPPPNPNDCGDFNQNGHITLEPEVPANQCPLDTVPLPVETRSETVLAAPMSEGCTGQQVTRVNTKNATGCGDISGHQRRMTTKAKTKPQPIPRNAYPKKIENQPRIVRDANPGLPTTMPSYAATSTPVETRRIYFKNEKSGAGMSYTLCGKCPKCRDLRTTPGTSPWPSKERRRSVPLKPTRGSGKRSIQ